MAMNIFKAWTGPCAFGFQTKNLDDHTISSLRSSRADAWILNPGSLDGCVFYEFDGIGINVAAEYSPA